MAFGNLQPASLGNTKLCMLRSESIFQSHPEGGHIYRFVFQYGRSTFQARLFVVTSDLEYSCAFIFSFLGACKSMQLFFNIGCGYLLV